VSKVPAAFFAPTPRPLSSKTHREADGAERHYLVTASSRTTVSCNSSNDSATNQDEIAQHDLMGGGVAGYSIGPKPA
jgi:hypothetical protein